MSQPPLALAAPLLPTTAITSKGFEDVGCTKETLSGPFSCFKILVVKTTFSWGEGGDLNCVLNPSFLAQNPVPNC